MRKPNSLLFNITFSLNCLLAFLLLFEQQFIVPGWLQVIGRMHPLILHFPIVLLVLCIFWELFVSFRTNDQAANIRIGDMLLIAAALASVLTALMGLFLSKEEGYTRGVLVWHKWAGVIISFLLLGWYAFRRHIRQRRFVMIGTAFTGMVVIVVTGHQGANITHGENFLLAPVMNSDGQPAVAFEDAVVYSHIVQPIIQIKCISCHNSTKAKGELVMETATLLAKGGKNGPLWDTSNVETGLLMRRIHLPENDKKHMPPAGKPQLTNEEIAILYHWIKTGASFTTKLADLPTGDTLRTLAASRVSGSSVDNFDFNAADESTVKRLNNEYRMVTPVALNSPGLAVQFFNTAQYKSDHLKELLEVKEQVVSLTLNKMPVTNDDLKVIGQFSNLRKLNLSFTNITGDALPALSGLKALKQLSLSGTKTKAVHLKSLIGLPELRELAIWNTLILPTGMKDVQQQFAKVRMETGFFGDTIVLTLTPPIIENEEVVITSPIDLKLKHYIKGAVLRYTVDGSNPDSTTSAVYTKPVPLTDGATVKVKAFKPGWHSSVVVNKTFYRSAFKPDSVRLLTASNERFSGDGGRTIIDGQKGTLDFRAGKWLGFREQHMEALLYFDQPENITKITIGGMVDINSNILPPQSIEVWAGESADQLRLVKKVTPAQPVSIIPSSIKTFDVELSSVKNRMIKLVVRPVPKLPAWHPKKGEKAWAFVDEVFVN